MLTPTLLENAPAHDEEARPGEDAERQAKSPDGEIGERVQVSPPHPLQVPWHIGGASGLGADLFHAVHPLRIGQQAIEGVGLEDAEGEEGGEGAEEEANGN